MRLHLVFSVALAFAVRVTAAISATGNSVPPLWPPSLSAGDFGVGFRVIDAYDYERTWRSRSALPQQLARPVRITLWYPVQRASKAEPMRFRQYVQIPAKSADYQAFNARIAADDMGEHGGGIRGLFAGDAALIDRLMNSPVAAIRDARPATRRFPLLIYSLGQNDYTVENTVLWEYLASHGYVVAVVPDLGTSPRRFQLWIHDASSYEAQVRDLEFALATIRRETFVDSTKISAIGHSMGGTYALMLAMRNQMIRALVGLDPSFLSKAPSYHYDITKWPDFDVAAVKIPMLLLYRKSDSFRDDLVHSLRFSDRTLIELDHFSHGDFASTAVYQLHAPTAAQNPEDMKIRTPEEAADHFALICRTTLEFLDSLFSGSRAFHQPSQGVLTALPGIHGPNEEELFTLFDQQGVAAALKTFRDTQRSFPNDEVLSEPAMRRIGNELMYGGQSQKAADWFMIDVEAHPNSAAAHRRLAEAFLESGDKAGAIAEYEHVLQIDKNDADAVAQLTKLKTP